MCSSWENKVARHQFNFLLAIPLLLCCSLPMICDCWSATVGLWSWSATVDLRLSATLVFGLWSLVFGLWSLNCDFGLWSLTWTLVFGLWSLVFELRLWTVFGLWSLNCVFGLWSWSVSPVRKSMKSLRLSARICSHKSCQWSATVDLRLSATLVFDLNFGIWSLNCDFERSLVFGLWTASLVCVTCKKIDKKDGCSEQWHKRY